MFKKRKFVPNFLWEFVLSLVGEQRKDSRFTISFTQKESVPDWLWDISIRLVGEKVIPIKGKKINWYRLKDEGVV